MVPYIDFQLCLDTERQNFLTAPRIIQSNIRIFTVLYVTYISFSTNQFYIVSGLYTRKYSLNEYVDYDEKSKKETF